MSDSESDSDAEEVEAIRLLVRKILVKEKANIAELFANELHRRGCHLDGYLTSEYHNCRAFDA